MEIITHYPKTEEAQAELKKAAARVHVDLIAGLVSSLPCSEEQKRFIVKSLYGQLFPAEPL